MAKSNNGLWIGAIVIVAALTAVELMSTHDNDDATATSDTANPIATNSISETHHTAEAVDTAAEQALDFDPSAFQAPNLVIDLDNPENIHAYTETDTPDEIQPAKQLAEAGELPASATGTQNDTPASSAQTITTEQPVNVADTNDLTDASIADVRQDSAENVTAAAPTESAPIPHTHDIAQHMAEAEQAIKELRLTTPKGNSAYEHYQAILALNANHAGAQAGMQKIIDMYIYFIEKAIAEGKPPTAKAYLQRAESLQPESARLKALRAELE